MQKASTEFDFGLNLGETARIWKGGLYHSRGLLGQNQGGLC